MVEFQTPTRFQTPAAPVVDGTALSTVPEDEIVSPHMSQQEYVKKQCWSSTERDIQQWGLGLPEQVFGFSLEAKSNH